VLSDTRPEYAPGIIKVQQLRLQLIEHVATAGAPADEHLRRRLRIVIDVFGAATRRWLAGVSSAAEARFEIRIGCYLLREPHDGTA